MSDLISRSALLESMIHCDGLGRKSMEAVLKVINEQPTVEAVPVVRGEWEYDIWLDTYICSRCLKTSRHRTRYCQDCGADMRKSD